VGQSNQTIRQKLHVLAEELLPDASWDGVIEDARFRTAVELGNAAVDLEAFASDEVVRSAFARWSVKS
jgi:hypothetical protein